MAKTLRLVSKTLAGLARRESSSRRRRLARSSRTGPSTVASRAHRPPTRTARAGTTRPPCGHAAMIGREVPAPGGPHELDAPLFPPPALPHQPGRVREYDLIAVDRKIEVAQGVFFDAWTYNGTVPGPIIRATEDDILRVNFTNARRAPAHDPLPRHPPGRHGRRLRDRSPGRIVHLRVPRAAIRDAALPLPRDAAQEAHPQGPVRRVHRRPEGTAAACAGARHGHERLRHGWRRGEQLLHRQRTRLLLREVPDQGEEGRARARSISRT